MGAPIASTSQTFLIHARIVGLSKSEQTTRRDSSTQTGTIQTVHAVKEPDSRPVLVMPDHLSAAIIWG